MILWPGIGKNYKEEGLNISDCLKSFIVLLEYNARDNIKKNTTSSLQFPLCRVMYCRKNNQIIASETVYRNQVRATPSYLIFIECDLLKCILEDGFIINTPNTNGYNAEYIVTIVGQYGRRQKTWPVRV